MTQNVEVILTPSREQYEQFTRDLEALRKAGATSNTAAVVEAVRQLADSVRSEPVRSTS